MGERKQEREKMKERKKQRPPNGQGEIKVVQGGLLSLRGTEQRGQKSLGEAVRRPMKQRCRGEVVKSRVSLTYTHYQ